MSDTRTQILDLAEKNIRQRGYHAVSFRDLADALGIKSASIHYHFRRKEDLGAVVVGRYAERVAQVLGPSGVLPWADALELFCTVYRNALSGSDLQCLCGMLGAETMGLPDGVSDRVKAFYTSNLVWLAASMPDDMADKNTRALRIQAELLGAMTLSVSLDDHSVLDQVSVQICATNAG